MTDLADIKTPADALRNMKELLAAIRFEADRVGAGELIGFCERARELVEGLLKMETH